MTYRYTVDCKLAAQMRRQVTARIVLPYALVGVVLLLPAIMFFYVGTYNGAHVFPLVFGCIETAVALGFGVVAALRGAGIRRELYRDIAVPETFELNVEEDYFELKPASREGLRYGYTQIRSISKTRSAILLGVDKRHWIYLPQGEEYNHLFAPRIAQHVKHKRVAVGVVTALVMAFVMVVGAGFGLVFFAEQRYNKLAYAYYSDDANYYVVECVVTECTEIVGKRTFEAKIEGQQDMTCDYMIYGSLSEGVELRVGDRLVITTAKPFRGRINHPVVQLERNGVLLLDYETGKKALVARYK